jgi:hypothetical protein
MNYLPPKTVSSYEELREKVLMQQPVDMGCFLKKGFPGWLTVDEEKDPTLLPSFPPFTSSFITISERGSLQKPLPPGIVPILTAIMFHHQKGERHVHLPPCS